MPPPGRQNRPLVLLDACVLINLHATGRIEEMLAALPYRFAVARYVLEEETLSVLSGQDAQGRAVPEPIRLGSLVEAGLLEVLQVTSPAEQRALVRFAIDLDDGEAHTCALAVVRGGRVATDDRKARRVLASSQTADPPPLRTSDLLVAWSRAEEVSEDDLRQALLAVTRSARFLPPRDDPHAEWWRRRLEEDP